MGLDLTAASNILKVRYIGEIREQLNNATVLLNKIGRQDQMVSGKDFTVPLHTSRNISAGTGIGDNTTLPTAGQQGYTTTVVPNKYIYGSIFVTGPTIAATRDNVGAFVEALNSEVDGLMRDMKRDVNRQLNGDGTGALAYVAAAWTSTATTGLVDDGLGNPFVHLPSGVAVTLDVIDETNHTTVLAATNSFTLGAASSTAYTATFTPGDGAALADGDYFVRSSPTARTAGSTTYVSPEMMGIYGIIDSGDPVASAGGSLQGLAVGSNAFWAAQVLGSYTSPRALAFEDLQQLIDLISTNSDYSEQDIAFLYSNYGARRAYYKLCIAERRHVNTMELDGGFKAVDFNGIGWVCDAQAKRNNVVAIVPETMKVFRTSDFDWMDKDGSYLARASGKDAYEAVLFHYGNLACLTRNANGILKGIIEA